MEFTIKAGSPEKLKNGCVVAGVLAGGELGAAARALDEACDGAISARQKAASAAAEPASCLAAAATASR